MKKLFYLVCFTLVGTAIYSQTNCECGDYESGRTFYQVGAEEGCCTGTPGERGIFVRYEQNEGGTWKVISSDEIGGTQAQIDCCRQSS